MELRFTRLCTQDWFPIFIQTQIDFLVAHSHLKFSTRCAVRQICVRTEKVTIAAED